MNRSSIPIPPVLALGCAFLCAGRPAAQAPESAEPAAFALGSALIRDLHGVAWDGGAVVAGGPDYKARFEGGEMRFTPALGRAVAEPQTLRFAFVEVRRGRDRVAAAAPAPVPSVEGDLVTIEHEGGVVERYRVAPEGLHQSFVIPARPEGTGDLVVSGRVATVLPPGEPTADGGLAFRRPGIGGVTFGAVTGIDARGATAAGSLLLAGDRLELVLPAAFVDGAAYPLLVDPLIGSEVVIDDSTWDDFDPDVAANPFGIVRYLAVWERVFAIGDIDVRGARLGASGAPVGGLLFLESGDPGATNPKVAFSAYEGRYLVVWQQQDSIFTPFRIVGRAVTPADAAASDVVTIASSAFNETEPEVAGDRTTADNDCLVVWKREGTGIMGQQVTVIAGNPSPIGSLVTIADDFGSGAYRNPAISKSGGDAGVYLLAWENGTTDVLYLLIDRNLNLITGAFILGASVGGLHRRPACAGNGETFLMVWERGEDASFDFSDVYGLSLSYVGGTHFHNDVGVPIEHDVLDTETEPDVVCNGRQFVVAYLDQDALDTNVYAKAVDPYTCLTCEPETAVSTPPIDRTPALASAYAGGSSFSDVFLVWGNGTAGTGDVYGQPFSSPHGQIDLGGDCGAGGSAETPCPFAGNANFRLHLRDAQAATPAFLVIAFQTAPFGCGPCTIHPSLATADVIAAGPTDANGDTAVAIPIPPLAGGASFWSQWGVLSAGGCDAFGVVLSNGVRTNVQP